MNIATPCRRAATTLQRRLLPVLAPVLGLVFSLLLVANAQAQVGMATLQVGDLPVTLVYPTAQRALPQAFGPFELTAPRDAAPLPGTRRLVVLSHGTGGSPLADHALAATLARAGFVAAQPLHRGDNYQDSSQAGPASWAQRPLEVTRVIDALASHPQWQGLLALDRVGVHGMSAGGVTALSLAGAQWRLLDLVRHCQAQADADFGFCFSGLVDPQAQAARRASYERARNVPDGLLPAELKVLHGGRTPTTDQDEVRPDPRVAAVTLAVPLTAIFSTASLARVRVPVGVVSAGQDTWLLPAFHSTRLLRDCGACTLLSHLPGAAHMDLLSPWPASLARAAAAQQPRGGLPEPGFDARQRDAAFEQIAAFYQRELAR